MEKPTNFYNEGFGWVCKNCELKEKTSSANKERSRLMTEGEAESKNPQLSNKALAKWADFENRLLVCPKCGVKENIGNL